MRNLQRFFCLGLMLCVVIGSTISVAAQEAYLVGYTLSTDSWVRDYNNDTIPTADLTITITDSRLDSSSDFSSTTVIATPHSGAFEAVPASIQVSSSSYCITFPNVKYYGGDNVFSFDIAYYGLARIIENNTDSQEDSSITYTEPYTLPVVTISQEIGQCRTIEKVKPESPEPPPTYTTPSLLVESVVWDHENVQPGETVDLIVTILAGSGTENLVDVFAELILPDSLYANEGITGRMLGEISPGSRCTARFSLTLSNIIDSTQNITINLSAIGKESRLPINSNGSTTLHPTLSDRFTLIDATLKPLTVDVESELTAHCVNMGRQTIYNITTTLLDENGEQLSANYLGNLESGMLLDISIPITPKTVGEHTWKLLIQYETFNNESRTILRTLSSTVNAIPLTNDQLQSPVTQVYDLIRPKDSATPPFWCWLLIIASSIMALTKLILGQIRTLAERKFYLCDK